AREEGSELVIGAVSVLRPEKRLDLLMEAFARVRSTERGIRLLIVGSGESLGQLEEKRRQMDLEKACVLEPAKSDVPNWLHRMDVFVLASNSESFPNALLEAMACGCCVIGSAVGGVPELIRDQENGLLFQSGDVDDLAAKLTTVIRWKDLRT